MGEIKKSHQWEHKKRHALTIEQQSAVSTFLDTHEDYIGWRPIITVLLGTGMRIGECLGLRWEDIDFKANEIDVNHNLIYRKNLDAKVRTLEGIERVKGFIGEEFDTDVEIVENGVHYMIDVVNGQKTGFFLDQKYNRLAMQRLCKGKLLS